MRVGIVAGEASGDSLGAGLVESLRRMVPDAEFRGIAGPRMAAAGVQPLFDATELSVMGLVEILGRLPRLMSIRRTLLNEMRAWRPDVFIGIDSPDFNLPVEMRLRTAGLRTVHYVSPTIWAWRPERVKVVARAADAVLCLFPFEPEHYAGTGVEATFVGHPLADRLAPDAAARAQLRDAYGLHPGVPVVALLPGSRAGEVRRLGPVFAGAMQRLAARADAPAFVAPMVSDALAVQFGRQCRRHAAGVPVALLREDSRSVIAASDVVLTTSGTATLETMLLDRPMVVAYRLAPLTAWLIKRFKLMRIEAYSQPNLLAGRRIVPERIQRDANPAALAEAVGTLLDDPAAMAAQREAFAPLRDLLKQGADDRAAEAVIAVANR